MCGQCSLPLCSCMHVILCGPTFSDIHCNMKMDGTVLPLRVIEILNSIDQFVEKAAISGPERTSRALAVITCPFSISFIIR